MKLFFLLPFVFLLASCGNDGSSEPFKNEDRGAEVLCTSENEGMIIKPADSDKDHICKNGSWNVVDSSRHCEDCGDEAISISSSSILNNNVILSASDESSSSILNSSSSSIQPTESSDNKVIGSSSSIETSEESSSSEKNEESSSSEEITMFLCDDGVTYVLDLANCETESSSSEENEESSSSEVTTQSSSENVEESSSSEESEESSSSEESEDCSSSMEQSSSSEIKPCKSETEDHCTYGTLYDTRDGKTYKTITIGSQEWMAENLNYKCDSLNFVNRSVCHPDPDSCAKYGRYYYWGATMDSLTTGCGYGNRCNPKHPVQGVCPKGWHIPNLAEIQNLLNLVGESISAQMLRADNGWTRPRSCNGNDGYGFAALPTGCSWGGKLNFFREKTYITINAEESTTRRKFLVIDGADNMIGCTSSAYIDSWNDSKGYALPVRCIKD